MESLKNDQVTCKRVREEKNKGTKNRGNKQNVNNETVDLRPNTSISD